MKLSDFATYNDNPFNITGVNIKHIIRKGEVTELTNTTTGEIQLFQQLGEQLSFNKDSLQFTKVYNGAVKDIKNFSSPAIKVWCYIIENLSINRDSIIINVQSCAKYAEYDSKSVVYKGICELIAKGFIARKVGVNEYFINPDKFFNGKRV
jgi:hypothetical protein